MDMNSYFKEECAACIVLYNPDICRLEKNIRSIMNQVKIVYCYNNCSKNTKDIVTLLNKYSNCRLINKKNNDGIAKAINYSAIISYNDGCKWLLTLDQDSICPNNMISKFKEFANNKKIGIICPRFVDKRRYDNIEVMKKAKYVDFCITSGSLMNLNVFFELGGMDEYLFVGLIDDDYCFRLRANGYRIIEYSSMCMDHELGNIEPKRNAWIYLSIGNMLKSSKIRALSYKREVSPLRVYYATRNIVYLSKKYENPPYKFSKRYAVINGISSVLRADNKIKVWEKTVEGFKDGLSSKVDNIKYVKEMKNNN